MSRPARPRFHAGNARWCAQIGPRGANGKSTTVYFPREIRPDDEAGAWSYLRDYLARQAEPARQVSEAPTLGALAVDYLDWVEVEVRSRRMDPTQLKNKRTHLKRFCQFQHRARASRLGEKRAVDLDIGDMEGFVRTLQEADNPRSGGKGYSAHYIRNVLRTVMALLNWAARPIAGRGRLIAENPVAGWKSGVTTRKEFRLANPSVIRAFRHWGWSRARWGWVEPGGWTRTFFRDKLKPPPPILRNTHRRFDRIFLLMISFISLTGCRPKEACNLRWSDLTWDDASRRFGVIRMDQWKNARKTGKQRVIFVLPRIARILRAIEDLPGRHAEWVFTHRIGPRSPAYSEPGPHRLAGEPWPDGTSLGAKLRKFRRWAIEAGVRGRDAAPIEDSGPNRLVNYLFRHTYISKAIMDGMTDIEVAELTGTSAEMIRSRYLHVKEEYNRKNAERIDAIGRKRPKADQ